MRELLEIRPNLKHRDGLQLRNQGRDNRWTRVGLEIVQTHLHQESRCAHHVPEHDDDAVRVVARTAQTQRASVHALVSSGARHPKLRVAKNAHPLPVLSRMSVPHSCTSASCSKKCFTKSRSRPLRVCPPHTSPHTGFGPGCTVGGTVGAYAGIPLSRACGPALVTRPSAPRLGVCAAA